MLLWQSRQQKQYEPKQIIFFASMCAFIKLEGLSVRYKMNNFALKSSLYISAIKTAYKQLRKFMPKDFEFGFECA